DLGVRGGQLTHKLNVFAQVLVLPLPLVTGNLDIDLGVGGVVEIDQGLGGGHGHDDQGQRGNHRPGYFNHGAFVEIGGLIALGFAVHNHAVKHDREHHDPDHHTDPENDHVQVIDLPAHLGNAGGHVDHLTPGSAICQGRGSQGKQ